MSWILLALAGGVGSLLRFGLDSTVSRRVAGAFPYGTLAVNVSGSFALGLLTGLGVGGESSFVFGTGLLGAYTTFSTWMFETERLGEDGETAIGLANVVLGVAAGLAAAGAGWAIGAAL
jgi:CrcB protein